MGRRMFYVGAMVSALLLVAMVILWAVSYYRDVRATFVTAENKEYILGGYGGRAFACYGPYDFPGANGLHFAARRILPNDEERWSYLTWNTSVPAHSFTSRYVRIYEGGGGLEVPDTAFSFLGVLWYEAGPSSSIMADLCIPFSYLAVVFAILPALAWRSVRRRRRVARVGCCGKCGYDLRAHEPGSRCPECGTVIDGETRKGR